MKIKISGMTCHHCSAAVRNALLASENVETAVVDHKKGTAIISGSDFDITGLEKIIEDAGYSFEEAEKIE